MQHSKYGNTDRIQSIRSTSMAEKVAGGVAGFCIVGLIVGYCCKDGKYLLSKEKVKWLEEEHAKEMCKKDKAIEQLQSEISAKNKGRDIAFKASAMAKVAEAAVFRSFLEMADKPLVQPSNDDWQQVLALVEQYLPAFRTLLINEKSVSRKEYILCFLVLFAFKPGQMVNLTGYSSSDISKTRQRLLQKLFGVQGSATEFDRRFRGLVE